MKCRFGFALCLSLLAAPAALAGEKPKLIQFELRADERVAETALSLNAEIFVVLNGLDPYQLVTQAELAGQMLMDPAESLAFCRGAAKCISELVAETGAALVVHGDVKPSFDGSKLLVHLVLVDVAAQKNKAEKFGQLDAKADPIRETGDLLRALLGIQPPREAAPAKVSEPETAPGPEKAAKPAPEATQGDEAELARRISAPAPEPRSCWSNPWTWTAAGLGVASIGTGVILGVVSRDRQREAANRAALGKPLLAYEAYQDAEDLALGANIVYGIGGAALVTAVVLFAIDALDSPPAVSPQVACSGSGCSASFYLRF
ncbi:MAG: hypothetical protein JXR96_07055 [Deltaproteobacteria bacterium]|nr:hypothetical protein [Deltaproteobacteria bacterium]